MRQIEEGEVRSHQDEKNLAAMEEEERPDQSQPGEKAQKETLQESLPAACRHLRRQEKFFRGAIGKQRQEEPRQAAKPRRIESGRGQCEMKPHEEENACGQAKKQSGGEGLPGEPQKRTEASGVRDENSCADNEEKTCEVVAVKEADGTQGNAEAQ